MGKITGRMILRELEEQDIGNGFYETLDNLRPVGGLTPEQGREVLRKIKGQDGHVFVALEDDQVVGAVTLLVEQKFIRKGALAGHIEDVSTRKGHEGKGIARQILAKAIAYAKERGCYKVILDCDEALIPFYAKSGFVEKERQMRLDL